MWGWQRPNVSAVGHLPLLFLLFSFLPFLVERAVAVPVAVDLELRCIALGLTLKIDDPACGAPKERDAPEQSRLPCLVTGA